MTALELYLYPKCSTCRQAKKWLDERDLNYTIVSIVEETPSKEKLKKILERGALPLEKLFNRSGQSYRSGNFKERLPKMSEDEALSALAADGMLIKRPLLVGQDFALVGFDEQRYREQLG